MAARAGAVIEVIPDDADRALDPLAPGRRIDGRVRLTAVTWAPTDGGLVNPAAAVGRIARAHGIPLLLDACRAVGQMPVDVAALGCDMPPAASAPPRPARADASVDMPRRMPAPGRPARIRHPASPASR